MEIKAEACDACGGKGFVEEESGVVSPHIPYEKEIVTDICGACEGKSSGRRL